MQERYDVRDARSDEEAGGADGAPEVRRLLGTLADAPPRAVDLVPGALGRYDAHRRRTRIAAVAGSALAVVGAAGAVSVLPSLGTAARTSSSASAGGTVTVGSWYDKALSCPASMLTVPLRPSSPGGSADERQLCLAQMAALEGFFPDATVYPQLAMGPIPQASPDTTFESEGMAHRIPAGTKVEITPGMFRIISGAEELDLGLQYLPPGGVGARTGAQCDDGTIGQAVALDDGLSGAYCAGEDAVQLHDGAGHRFEAFVFPQPKSAQRYDPGFDLVAFAKDPRVAAMIMAGMHTYYQF